MVILKWNDIFFELLSKEMIFDRLLPRFHVPFWLSRLLVYLFYFCPSRSIVNKQSYG